MTQSTLQKISSFSITLFLITGFSSINNITNVGTLNVGNTLFVGGSRNGKYTTIQSAIDAANTGDTVFVYTGVYYENIVIEKKISLDGENRNTTIIDGMNDNIVIYIVSDNITVSGFCIKNSGGLKDNAAMYIHSDNTTISTCIIYRSRMGININNSSTTKIDNCIFHTNSDADPAPTKAGAASAGYAARRQRRSPGQPRRLPVPCWMWWTCQYPGNRFF